MDIQRLVNALQRDEGIRLKPYTDTVGKLTIGVGRNLDDKGLSRSEALYLLANDIDETRRALMLALPWFNRTDPVRQEALVNMGFMGVRRLLGFKRMLAAMAEQDYETAANEAMNSKWAGQVGERAERISAQIRTGVAQ
jgi:lysozyme